MDRRINIENNVHITQSNVQIQCYPYQKSNDIFHKNGIDNPKMCMEPQKIPNSQSNLEKEEQSWRHYVSWFQTILQSYSNHKKYAIGVKTDT